VEIHGHEKAGSTDSALKGRLSAALAINEQRMREDAVAAVAIDAAKAGNAAVVTKALSQVRGQKRRDDLRSSCAFDLAMAGKLQEAVEIAKTIDVTSLKDETLKRIATLK
jgi:hypothetical protein